MSLNNRTAAEYREIAARYNLPITGEVGNRSEVTSFFMLCMIGSPVVLLFLTLIFVMMSGIYLPLGLALTLIVLGSAAIDWSLFFLVFLVSVPKLGAAIVLDRLTGVYHVCTPGWNIVKPTEEYYWDTDDLTQRAGTIEKTSEFLTQDGVGLSFSWTVQEGPCLPLLLLNIRFNADDVSSAVTEIVENTISEEILDIKAADIMKGHVSIDTLQADLLKAMRGDPPQRRDELNSSIEERVGSNMEYATLGPPQFAGEYKEALVTSKTVEIMKNAAETLTKKDGLGLDGSQAMDTVLILNNKGVKKDIFKIEADGNTRALAGAIGGILKTVDKTASRLPLRGKRSGGGSPKPAGAP